MATFTAAGRVERPARPCCTPRGRVYSIQEVADSDEKGRFVYVGIPAGTNGEVAVFHQREGRQTGAKTVGPIRVDEPVSVEVPDVVIPSARPEKHALRIEGGFESTPQERVVRARIVLMDTIR